MSLSVLDCTLPLSPPLHTHKCSLSHTHFHSRTRAHPLFQSLSHFVSVSLFLFLSLIHTHIYTHIHTHIHAHTHTLTHTPSLFSHSLIFLLFNVFHLHLSIFCFNVSLFLLLFQANANSRFVFHQSTKWEKTEFLLHKIWPTFQLKPFTAEQHNYKVTLAMVFIWISYFQKRSYQLKHFLV